MSEARKTVVDNRYDVVRPLGSGGMGEVFLARDRVLGRDVALKVLRRQFAGDGEFAERFRREARSAAHDRDMVHRDVKPQNVLLTARGDAKVADFGIARAGSSVTISKTGSVMGTAGYMSPEQALGEPATSGSDLYSLGVVLYEALTGELPFTADNPIAVSMKHVTEPLRSPREIDPTIPEGMNALIVKLMAKDPADRYASASDLADDLRRVSSGLAPVA